MATTNPIPMKDWCSAACQNESRCECFLRRQAASVPPPVRGEQETRDELSNLVDAANAAWRDLDDWRRLAEAQRATHSDPQHAPQMPTEAGIAETKKIVGWLGRAIGPVENRLLGLSAPVRAEAEPLKAENERLKAAILWALGEEGEFSEEPEPLAGKYRQRFWWRAELRRRAFDSSTSPVSAVEPLKALVALAERIARRAHEDQKCTVTGEPYIRHVERVASMVEGEAKAVAWLHDVLEDAPITSLGLEVAGIPGHIIDAVLLAENERFGKE